MTRPLFLGLTDDRERPTDDAGGRRRPFTLTDDQRATGMHVIGAPGSGKSKFLEHCIRQDIRAGRPLCLIDPHGELYEHILEWCAYLGECLPLPVIPLNVSSGAHVIGFNPFAGEARATHTVVNRAIAATVKAWGLKNTDETPTLERVLRSIYHAIIDNHLTVAEARHLLSTEEEGIRDYLTGGIADPLIREEWRELASLTTRDHREEFRSTKNKLLRFLTATPVLRFMALTESLDLRRIMDEGAVLLVNLKPNEDTLDEMDARLFGSMLVSKFFSVARQRGGRGQEAPRSFYLYCDEFQNFVSPDVVEILPQGRKMGLSMILAHQFLGQLVAEDVQLVEAVMAAVRTRVVFGLESYDDAVKLVPSVFRGLIDFHEVKRIDYSLKYWQEYDRDQVITEGEGETEGKGHQHGRGHGSGIGGGGADIAGAALATSYQTQPDGTAGPTVHSDARNTGHVTQSNWLDTDSEFESWSTSYAKSRMHTVADVPIYRQIPVLEGAETPWSLEEQKHRLAEVLTMQLQQYCWVKPREALAKPVVVPWVKPYRQPAETVSTYEAGAAKKAGAITPAAVDRITTERTKLLEHKARAFFDLKAQADVDSQKYVEPDDRPKRKRAPTPARTAKTVADGAAGDATKPQRKT